MTVKAVRKFVLTDTPIDMPKGAEVLRLASQHGTPCLWALVDPDAPKEARKFVTYATGENIPTTDDKRYVGTFVVNVLNYVYHVFEVV